MGCNVQSNFETVCFWKSFTTNNHHKIPCLRFVFCGWCSFSGGGDCGYGGHAVKRFSHGGGDFNIFVFDLWLRMQIREGVGIDLTDKDDVFVSDQRESWV